MNLIGSEWISIRNFYQGRQSRTIIADYCRAVVCNSKPKARSISSVAVQILCYTYIFLCVHRNLWYIELSSSYVHTCFSQPTIHSLRKDIRMRDKDGLDATIYTIYVRYINTWRLQNIIKLLFSCKWELLYTRARYCNTHSRKNHCLYTTSDTLLLRPLI